MLEDAFALAETIATRYARELIAVSLASVLMMIASVVVTPWLLVRIPADYFVAKGPPPWRTLTPGRLALRVAKNVLGAFVVLAGVLMLVLPGQGLLTILIGLLLLDFPGKRRLERQLVARPQVHRAIDWLRRKYGRPPLVLP